MNILNRRIIWMNWIGDNWLCEPYSCTTEANASCLHTDHKMNNKKFTFAINYVVLFLCLNWSISRSQKTNRKTVIGRSIRTKQINILKFSTWLYRTTHILLLLFKLNHLLNQCNKTIIRYTIKINIHKINKSME